MVRGRHTAASARDGSARLRHATAATVDLLCWAVALLATARLVLGAERFPGRLPELLLVAAAVAVAHLCAGLVLGPYLVRHVLGSFEEVLDVGRATLTAAAVSAAGLALIEQARLPWWLPVVAGCIAVTGMLAVRLVVRSWRSRRPVYRQQPARAIVLGAGVGGRLIVQKMLQDDQSPYRPVAFLDDDRAKRKLRIEGVRVLGDRTDLARVAAATDATHLVVAIPTAQAHLMREVRELADGVGLQLLVLPPIDEILDCNPRLQDLRDIDLADLLGRRQVSLDQLAIHQELSGRVVLVTGAGGSIGSELCRQISAFGPARLVLLDRDESALQAVQLSLTGRGLLEGDDLVLADIRDAERIVQVMRDVAPDVVFHAAALKHLPLLEKHPREAWKSNVLGTLNVLRAAQAAGVGTVVNISTDKAARPTSMLGFSKRLAERLTADFAARCPGRYVSVRFGNVLGSRGSVIPTFTEQIRAGGPVTVTHPDVERYFMLIPEACQLVMQAAAIGRSGQVMVLDMGEPVKIAEVARTLISMSGRSDIELVYTGLRPGEKLTEELVASGEEHSPSGHPLLSAVTVPALDPLEVDALEVGAPESDGRVASDDAALLAWVRAEAAVTGAAPDDETQAVVAGSTSRR